MVDIDEGSVVINSVVEMTTNHSDSIESLHDIPEIPEESAKLFTKVCKKALYQHDLVELQRYVIFFPRYIGWFMVFNATFNNISVILWSVLLVEETGVPEANHRLRYMNLVECVAGILLQMKGQFTIGKLKTSCFLYSVDLYGSESSIFM